MLVFRGFSGLSRENYGSLKITFDPPKVGVRRRQPRIFQGIHGSASKISSSSLEGLTFSTLVQDHDMTLKVPYLSAWGYAGAMPAFKNCWLIGLDLGNIKWVQGHNRFDIPGLRFRIRLVAFDFLSYQQNVWLMLFEHCSSLFRSWKAPDGICVGHDFASSVGPLIGKIRN